MLLFISTSEIIFILFAILLLFGADKIPEIAKTLGKGIRDIKNATDDIKNEIRKSVSDVEQDIKNTVKNNLDKKDIFNNEGSIDNTQTEKHSEEYINNKRFFEKNEETATTSDNAEQTAEKENNPTEEDCLSDKKKEEFVADEFGRIKRKM